MNIFFIYNSAFTAHKISFRQCEPVIMSHATQLKAFS